MSVVKFLKPINFLACSSTLRVSGISMDSSRAIKDSIFVAANNIFSKADGGHCFIKSAILSGCQGLILERFNIDFLTKIPIWLTQNARIVAGFLAEETFEFPSKILNLCAITGTDGKSTTAFLLAIIANEFKQKTAVFGTLGVGDPCRRLTDFGFTTPEGEDISTALACLANKKYINVALEVSSHALAEYRVDGLFFKTAALTSFSSDHLDYHVNLKNYFNAKIRLFNRLLPESGIAILPDCSFVLSKINNNRKILKWGYSSSADIRASNIMFTSNGIEFQLTIQKKRKTIKSRLFGHFNLGNILCAISLAYVLKIPMQFICKGLEGAMPPAGRLECILLKKPNIFIDFAHTANALQKTVSCICKIFKQLVVVFGCSGEKDRLKRPKMANAVVCFADIIYVTMDNSCYEDQWQIIADMEINPCGNIFLDREEAIKYAIFCASQVDAIIIAGRGHEDLMYVNNELLTLNDKECVNELLFNRLSNS